MTAHIQFDSELGLIVPSTEDIRQAVSAEWKQIFGEDLNTTPQSPQGQLIDSISAHIATKNTEILKLSQMFNPLTAENVWQDALGYIYFLQRKSAQATRVLCTIQGLANTVIPAYSQISDGKDTVLHLENQAVIESNGQVEAYFICNEDGPIEIAPHSIDVILSVIPGWDSVINEEEGIIGRYEETQKEFERRRYLSVSKNAHGSAAAVYGALANLPDVTDLVVLENRSHNQQEQANVSIDPHSVYISILGGKDEDIAKTIYQKLSAGCGTCGNQEISYLATDMANALYTYHITRPSPIDVYIHVVIKLTPLTPATIENDLKSALYNDFYALNDINSERVRMANTLYSSRFYNVVLQNNVQELVSIKLSDDSRVSWYDEIFIPADKVPFLSHENITISILED